MDEGSLHNKKRESQNPTPLVAEEGSSSSSSSSPVAARWHPSQLVFCPYTPVFYASAKSQTLPVAVRRPVSVLLLSCKFLF